MSDWAEDAMLKAFPRADNTYFLQLVAEPVVTAKQGQWGPFTQLTVDLQLFRLDDDQAFSYVGPVAFRGKSCVFADFTMYPDILLDALFKVVGFNHDKHVDLEIVKDYPRQYAGKSQPEGSDAPSVPLKHTEGESQIAPSADSVEPAPSPSTPCSHDNCHYRPHNHDTDAIEGFYCKDCGERVG